MHGQCVCVWIKEVSHYSYFYLFDAFGFKALTIEKCHPQAYEAYGMIGFGLTEIQIWEMVVEVWVELIDTCQSRR